MHQHDYNITLYQSHKEFLPKVEMKSNNIRENINKRTKHLAITLILFCSFFKKKNSKFCRSFRIDMTIFIFFISLLFSLIVCFF